MSFIYACRSYGHDKNTCHTVKMNSLDLSRLHFNKIYIPVKNSSFYISSYILRMHQTVDTSLYLRNGLIEHTRQTIRRRYQKNA